MPSFSNFVRCLSTSPHLAIVASTLFTAFPRRICQSEDSTLRRRFPQMIFLFGLIVFVVLAEGADGGSEKKVNVPRIWLRKECQTPPTPTQGPPFIVSSDQVDISARLKSRIVQRAFGINRMKFVNSNEVASNLPGKWLLNIFKSRREFRQTMIKVALDVGLPSLTF